MKLVVPLLVWATGYSGDVQNCIRAWFRRLDKISTCGTTWVFKITILKSIRWLQILRLNNKLCIKMTRKCPKWVFQARGRAKSCWIKSKANFSNRKRILKLQIQTASRLTRLLFCVTTKLLQQFKTVSSYRNAPLMILLVHKWLQASRVLCKAIRKKILLTFVLSEEEDVWWIEVFVRIYIKCAKVKLIKEIY